MVGFVGFLFRPPLAWLFQEFGRFFGRLRESLASAGLFYD
tara:strand:- start:183 stop:302 length:120 start_codon:yes stop_codon:yes gene_type:complete